MKYLRIAAVLAISLPSLALAQAVSKPGNFKELVDIILRLIERQLIPLVFALTFLFIIWSLIKGWIIHGGDSDGVESGKKVATVGTIALVIMISIWGILALLQTAFTGR